MKTKATINKNGKEIIMKTIKKLFAVLFSIAMLVGTGITAFAGESGNDQTITINDDRANRTYVAYQIVRGEISGGVLSNIKWGDGQTTHTVGDPLTEAELTLLPGSSATRDQIKTYIDGITLSTTYYSSVSENGKYVINNLYPGWYLIKETTDTKNKDDFTSAFMVKVVGNVEASPKGSKTTLTKKVDDVNDSNASDTNSNSIEQDSADYDIGDDITYTLTATLGADLTDYTSYKLSFVDNMSKGLTYKELVSVTVKHDTESRSIDTSNVAVADGSAYAIDGSSAYSGGTIKTFTITNVLDTTFNAVAGDTIIIKYKATLNENAVIGSQGNPNKVYLEYSNNPAVGTEVGRTPEDINIVFTYKTVFNKVDTDGKPLTGADFKLEKFISNESGNDTYNNKKGTWTDVTTLSEGNNKPKKTVGSLTKENVTATNAQFTFSGLDDGVYRLTETVTPATYNTIDPIIFTITATHDLISDDPQLTALTGTDGAQFTMTSNLSDGSLTANIENKKGNTLPSTGGIGTTVFYVIGGVLVAGAAVVLIAKNKMSKN